MRGHQSAVGKREVFTGGVGVTLLPTDRRVQVRAIACPECKAGVGESCVNATGGTAARHASRRRMALRAEREQIEPRESVVLERLIRVRKMPAHDRRAAREALGLTMSALAQRIDMSYQSVRRWERGGAVSDLAGGTRYAEILLGSEPSGDKKSEPLRVASDVEMLPLLDTEQATARRLVTRTQIARRFKVSPSALAHVVQTYDFPPVVARLREGGAPDLFDARLVEASIRVARPRWFERTAS